MEEEFTGGTFTVNYNLVANSDNHCFIARHLARMIQDNSYLTVGQFFKQMTNNDIEYMNRMIDESDEAEDNEEIVQATSDLAIIALMLDQAEGGQIKNLDDVIYKVGALKSLIVLTSLARLGLAEVIYENFSLQREAGDLIIAKKKNDK